MIKIYAFFCLLSALSIAELKILNITGRVGKKVTITCSDWNVWFNVKSNVKFFCNSPCTEDKDIIIKAKYGETKQKNGITLINNGKGLDVTFTNLQKSDSKKYYCGVERIGRDSYIEVNLKVTDAEFFSPKTTPKTAIVASTLSFAVTNSSTVSSSSSDIIADMSMSHITHSTTTATASQGAGSLPYLIFGVISLITILMVLLKLMWKMRKKQLKVVSSADTPQEVAREDVAYDEIRPQDQHIVSQPAGGSTDSLYANYTDYQDTELAAESGNAYSDVLYLNAPFSFRVNSRGGFAESRVEDVQYVSVNFAAQLPTEPVERTGQCKRNNSLYSLVQQQQTT